MAFRTLAILSAVCLTATAAPTSSQTGPGDICAITSVGLQQRPDGRFTPFRESLIPFDPSPPVLAEPVEETVIEGNLGMFLPPPGGARDKYAPALFRWDSGSGPYELRIRRRTLSGQFLEEVVYLGHTTHFDLCVFQTKPAGSTDYEAMCGDPEVMRRQHTSRQTDGVWVAKADCDQREFAPRPGGGMARGTVGWYSQTGFFPDYPSNTASIVHLGWKMRACNGARCSDWSAARRLVWVPPPTLISAGTRPGWQLFFKMSRVPNADGKGTDGTTPRREVDARVCVAAPGDTCLAERQKIPGIRWVARADISDTPGRDTDFVDNDPSHGNSGFYWFLGGWRNWSGATCWHPDRNREEDYCVYQENYEVTDRLRPDTGRE